jgi:alginate O-acetyltransferase complex protein AlgI
LEFNSIKYFLFLPLAVILYYLFPQKYKWLILLLTGIYFYFSFVPVFLTVFVLSIILNYFFAIQIVKCSNNFRKTLFVISVIINIILLILFKFPEIINVKYLFIILDPSFSKSYSLIYPIGLSYLAFKSISYLIDVYRNEIAVETNIGVLSSYFFFFPAITQGPIERFKNFKPQLFIKSDVNYDIISKSVKLIIFGLFKKLVIADRLSLYVNAVYDNYSFHSGFTLIIATIFFAFQIYADFSGYTDIALGSAGLMGIKLTDNFKRPYFSRSVSEFWNRWHITLSTFLRDYIFLPLAYKLTKNFTKSCLSKNFKENITYSLTVFVTFVICGLWHGTGWNYLIWGLLFGIFLSFGKISSKIRSKIKRKLKLSRNSKIRILIEIITVFILVNITWIFFRSIDLPTALNIIKKIFNPLGSFYLIDAQQVFFYSLSGIFILLIIEFYLEFSPEFVKKFQVTYKFASLSFYIILIILILLIGVFDGGQFIYFKF